MKYDIEKLEEGILALIQENIPAKIAEINAEKADGILLQTPTTDQYFNTTDDEVNNNTLSVMYGIIDGSPLSIGSNTAEDNRYALLFYLDEKNQAAGVVRKKLLRYIRASKEIFEENFHSKLKFVSSLKVETIAPTTASWDSNETSPTYKVGGVLIQASLVG